MTFDIKDIANMLAVASTTPLRSGTITHMLTDSRSLSDASTTLFFALETTSNDGHLYVGDLYRRGVRNFVVSRRLPEWEGFRDANFFVVASPLAALHTIATAHRLRHKTTEVIAVAGSRGKTTVKEWLFQALSRKHSGVVRSPRSFNSQIGVPLSLMEINDDTSIAIIESGISRPGEMERLERMIKPTIGIFVNLLGDHSEGFPLGDEQKGSEKSLLFKDCQKIVFNASDEPVVKAVTAIAGNGCELWSWSADGDKDARVKFTAEAVSETTSRIIVTLPGEEGAEMVVPYNSPTDLENLYHIATALAALGWRGVEICSVLPGVTPVVTRTEVMEGIKGSSLIFDRFSADLSSLDMALDFMGRRLASGRNGVLVLGELTDDPRFGSDELYKALGDTLKRRGVTAVAAVGEKLREMEPLWNENGAIGCVVTADTVDNMLLKLNHLPIDNRAVLIKGSPLQAGFQRIVEHLEARRHETVLEVNLDAIVNNYNFFRSGLRSSTGIVCMVKAFGYGAGSYELAKTLQSQGAAYLAVAVLDEGVELRRQGITMPIMVMNPRVVNYEEMFANRLEPEIFSFEELEEIIEQAKRYGVEQYPIHIKFDTGMHRLGFVGEDVDRLISLLTSTDRVVPSSMFSHLAAADDPLMDDYTLSQFEKFDKWCDKLQAAFPHHIKRHILNSTGITRFPEHQYDMVRLGICLYGVATLDDGSQQGLQRVSSLLTTIISIKEWPEGTTIGYNRRGVCRRPSRIATIPIGYADGIDRHLGNGAMKVWVGGKLCPTIGNICMDACMIDVTDCGDSCKVGDQVEIFGDHVAVASLAEALDTIPYEILTSVSTRVKRVYYRE